MKNESLKQRLDEFTMKLHPGKVYRASELASFSVSLSRDLKLLVNEKKLTYLGKGLYVRLRLLGEFEVPPERSDLMKKFLKTKHFLVRNFSDFNRLGLGLSQLYNQAYVYNERRDGKIELGGETYYLKRKAFPKDHHEEYLLVDMLNNLEKL